MVVRFEAPDPQPSRAPERSDLAEVIDLRSRLATLAVPSEPADDAPGEDESGLEEVRAHAVRVLARSARSSGELARALREQGHEPQHVDAVIEEFRDRLYLDDLGLARILTERLREKRGASRSQISRTLRGRLFDDSIIEVALGELDEEDEQMLLVAAAEDRARKLGGLPAPVAERRLLAFLARRGWAGESARRAATRALDSTNGSAGSVE